ncbi:MAG TPA: RNA polymerase sigma factor [Gemmatimonadales bacterium]|jgi:RNA polymerase sigma-70 factor (ECF subfamily)
MRTVAADLLLAEHAPALKNFLGARCRDDDLAADLMQEVAARLVAAAPRLHPNGNARGYLFRIATSVWHDHLRREVVRRRAAELLGRGEPALAAAADEGLIAAELGAAIRRAVAALPAPQREVVELRHRVSGALTFREIAERLGRPLGTVLTQMRAALAKIAAEVEDYR